MPDTVFEKLNDKNYADWHYMIEALLVEKDLWDVVDGTDVCPTGSVNLKAVHAFVKKQQVAQAKIILHIELSSSHMLIMKTQWRSGKVLNRSIMACSDCRG